MPEKLTGKLGTADVFFPVIMKYTGLLGSITAIIAAFSGVNFAAPLLGLFGAMMGIGQFVDALRTREGTEANASDKTDATK